MLIKKQRKNREDIQFGKNKKLTGAALIVMSSIIVSRITGFVREMLVPNLIGVNEEGMLIPLLSKLQV